MRLTGSSTSDDLTTVAHISVDALLRHAAGLEGERLATAGGRATFTVRVLPHGIEITPDSSGKPRVLARETIHAVLDQYSQSRNLQPGQYRSITVDAPYLLGIIARYVQDDRGRVEN